MSISTEWMYENNKIDLHKIEENAYSALNDSNLKNFLKYLQIKILIGKI
jgi:hypothetical protein